MGIDDYVTINCGDLFCSELLQALLNRTVKFSHLVTVLDKAFRSSDFKHETAEVDILVGSSFCGDLFHCGVNYSCFADTGHTGDNDLFSCHIGSLFLCENRLNVGETG